LLKGLNFRDTRKHLQQNDEKEIVFILRQEYQPKLMPVWRKVSSFRWIEGKVVYHEDMHVYSFPGRVTDLGFRGVRGIFEGAILILSFEWKVE
jgi:hypothetical protein